MKRFCGDIQFVATKSESLEVSQRKAFPKNLLAFLVQLRVLAPLWQNNFYFKR